MYEVSKYVVVPVRVKDRHLFNFIKLYTQRNKYLDHTALQPGDYLLFHEDPESDTYVIKFHIARGSSRTLEKIHKDIEKTMDFFVSEYKRANNLYRMVKLITDSMVAGAVVRTIWQELGIEEV